MKQWLSNGSGSMRCLLVITLLLTLMGCSSNKSAVGSLLNANTDVLLTIRAADDINPDSQQEPAPLFIRLYELTDPEAFERADFLSLYESEKATLGKDLVDRRQLDRIAPGESREEELVLSPETRYVGLLAEFNDYEQAEFHLVVPIVAHNISRDHIEVFIQGNRLSLVE